VHLHLVNFYVLSENTALVPFSSIAIGKTQHISLRPETSHWS
jgi:hypothetical protein